MKEYSGNNTLKHLISIIKSELNKRSDIDHIHVNATESSDGFMSADDKRKINSLNESGAFYEHPKYTPLTGVPTGAQRPKFGETFQVSQPVSDTTGHLMQIHQRGVTIPDNEATDTEHGLMSSADKIKLDSLSEAALKGIASTVVTYQGSTSGTTVPTGTWSSTIPSVAAGSYLWTRTVITYNDSTTSTSYSVGMMGATGPQGPTGDTGATGAAGAKGADGLTTAINFAGTVYNHSNGTITIADTVVQKAVTPATPTSGQIAVYDGANGKLKSSGFTIATSVPADAKFTDTVYTHPAYTARTGVPTANQTPAFGGTFTVSQPVSDATGHITAINSRTITIPSTVMGAATASAAGTIGLVPAPAAGAQAKFLRGDGTWQTPTNTDTKVTQTLTTTAAEYPLLLAPTGQTATATTTSLFATGLTVNASTKTISSSATTGTYLKGNQGVSLINSTAGAGAYTTLIKSNTTNGYMTLNNYQDKMILGYTAKTTVEASNNSLTKQAILLNEAGDSSFPGTVTATTFKGALSGNADTATTATTATKLGTATVGSTTKPFYLNAGTPTAFSTTIGSATKPVYVNAGAITACSTTVGGTAKPIYSNAGTLTAISATVGSANTPVYLNAGTITSTGGYVIKKDDNGYYIEVPD